MSNILQIGFTAEGKTDERFLSNIIRKTFENAVFDCNTDIEVYEPEYLEKEGRDFTSQIEKLTIEYSYFHVICVHCDSDSPTIEKVLKNKIQPAFNAVKKYTGDVCKNLVAIIPVQMTEAWMMADINLLKSKLGYSKSSSGLGLPEINEIENLSNPKDVINQAISIAQSNMSRRRRKISISELYSPISQELSISALEYLPSYKRFQNEVKDALIKLNYL